MCSNLDLMAIIDYVHDFSLLFRTLLLRPEYAEETYPKKYALKDILIKEIGVMHCSVK